MNKRAYKVVLISTALVALAMLSGFIDLAKSPRALALMTSAERLAYLRYRDVSDLVGYYCNRHELPSAVVSDVEKSLSHSHGVTRVTCSD